MRDGLLAQRAPRSTSREGRIELLAEVARALLDGRQPSREAASWLGSALTAWARAGGPIERHLRITAKRGSHRVPHVIFHSLIADERQPRASGLESGQAINEGTEL